MAYLIKRDSADGGGFVAKPGSRGSYTRDIAQARKYETREAADADRCPENEWLVPLEPLLDSMRR
jgi:hypothetical protein